MIPLPFASRFSLEGRVALVTGAGRGLGAAMALGLAQAGADVALLSRNRDELLAVAESIVGLGRRALPLVADVCVTAEVDDAVATIVREFGHLDIVVNNAGTNIRHGVADTTDEEWDLVTGTNLFGPFRVARAASRELAAGGRIINVGSVAGEVAIPTGVAYAAAKGGLHHLTRALAQELAPRDICVNAVAPWYFMTALTAGVLSDPAYRQRVLAETPLGRIGDPDADLVGLIVFLAGPSAGYLTGQVITVDGGMSVSRFVDPGH